MRRTSAASRLRGAAPAYARERVAATPAPVAEESEVEETTDATAAEEHEAAAEAHEAAAEEHEAAAEEHEAAAAEHEAAAEAAEDESKA